MSYDEFIQLCQKRHSVRSFTADRVNMQSVMKLLKVAQLAPSVENTQPWHFHIITNQEMREELMDTCCYGNFIAGASVFILVTCNRASKPNTQKIIWNPKELEYSCVGAMQYLILAATALGLGSCWVSMHHGRAHDVLKLKDNHVVIGGIMLGHLKKEDGGRSEHARRELGEMYTLYE